MFKLGDRVRIINERSMFKNCEGVIIEVDEDSYWLDLYKGNENIDDNMINEFDVFITEEDLELVIKLDVNKLREEKETRIISTEDSLIDIVPFYNPEDFK